jgi:NAD(P)-dependent dehydrogenase (short-subunit alcohol dehydrogenase family)
MEINFFGTIALTKSVLPHMLKQKSGHIVVISSIAGKFCSKSTDWQLIVAANPELQKRENQLDIDQVLKIPSSCQRKSL